MPLLDVADELWPSSQFTAAALAGPSAKTGRLMKVMPMAAEITEPERFCNVENRLKTRKRFGLPAEKVLFGYGFDLNSTAIRKNPMGAIEAFQRAFPLPHLPATFGRKNSNHTMSKQVSLIIKTFPPQNFSAEWEWLQARVAEDARIILIAESIPREELLSLYGCFDVFLSLHRSEGFGRGIAEALELGQDVIATDFGGNTDFSAGPLNYPMSWRKAPIPRGSYQGADDHYWAEPDLDLAAELCQEVAKRLLSKSSHHDAAGPRQDNAVIANYRKQFSFTEVGNRYRERLRELLVKK